ncbi:MAG: HAD-IA family hydrolase [Oscillospiraceae bacterium]|nr:HAD-IA family hydrolase [Oscillospiraceae bacterium]
MKYKAVLYDMDGTVLDTLGDLVNAVNYTMEHFGCPAHGEKEIMSFLGNGAKNLITCSAPAGTAPEKIDEMLEFYLPWYNSHCTILTAPYEGIIELMQELKANGVKQAVISNKQDSAVKPLAAQYFPGLLESALGESEKVKKKPNPDAVLAALKELGVDKSEAIYVGDSEVDVATAINADMACAAVSYGFRSEEELIAAGAKLICHSVKELRDYLMA